MEIFGWFSMLMFACCYIPQIHALWKAKSAEGISVWMWIMATLGQITGLIYTCYLKDRPLIVLYVIGVVASCTILLQIISKIKLDKKQKTE